MREGSFGNEQFLTLLGDAHAQPFAHEVVRNLIQLFDAGRVEDFFVANRTVDRICKSRLKERVQVSVPRDSVTGLTGDIERVMQLDGSRSEERRVGKECR